MSNSTSSDWVEIQLTQGLFAKVDAEDAVSVGAFKWRSTIRATGAYAVRAVRTSDGRRTCMYMHKFITGYAITDHINGDGLDNRRCNLREATRSENMHNMRRPSDNVSGYKGVCWDRRTSSWKSYIRFNGRYKQLGRFPNPIDAAVAYDMAARKTFGEYAALNFPGVGERAA